MTIPEILQALTHYTGKFPRAAMQAAVDQREAITPELLHALESVAADPQGNDARQHSMLPVLAIFLLAHFQETRAYAPLVKLLNAPGETADKLLGDTVSCGLDRILATVYDGNPAPLGSLIENEGLDPFVRSAVVSALVVLAKTGRLTRDEVAFYFGSLFRQKLVRTHSYVWGSLANAVLNLPAPELLDEVRRAFH